jgi:hypothetical protein
MQQQQRPARSPFSSAALQQAVCSVRAQASAELTTDTNAAPRQTLPKDGPTARVKAACTTELPLLPPPVKPRVPCAKKKEVGGNQQKKQVANVWACVQAVCC